MQPFVPQNLPLKGIDWSALIEYISEANLEIARYDGLLQSMVNPQALLSPLTTREAVISSKIEGTQATLEEVLRFEAHAKKAVETEKTSDIYEIINYRTAMNAAKTESIKRGISLNLLKRTHAQLLDSVRGQNKDPGNFRKQQNWIGKIGSTQEQARFVPPAPQHLMEHLGNLENYIHYNEKDKLVQIAIIHAQFEIIHPFWDGNGRIGRILIPLFLYNKGVLHEPMFYISDYFERNRSAYYDGLLSVSSTRDWTEWIIFFLKAVTVQAKENNTKAKAMLDLYEKMKQKVVDITHSQYSIKTMDYLFANPIFTVPTFIELSTVPRKSSIRIIDKLTDAGILDRVIKGVGNAPSIYAFKELMELVNQKSSEIIYIDENDKLS